MDLKLVPIPPDAAEDTAATWLPFVQRIAERSKDHPAQLIEKVMSGDVQVHVIWDAEAKEARALAGTRVLLRGDDRIGEMLWLVGAGREAWSHLFPELERYLREHQRCVGIKATCRPGWKKNLERHGYRLTHIVMERDC